MRSLPERPCPLSWTGATCPSRARGLLCASRSRSFDMHLGYLGPVSPVFTSLVSSGRSVGGLEAAVTGELVGILLPS